MRIFDSDIDVIVANDWDSSTKVRIRAKENKIFTIIAEWPSLTGLTTAV